MRRTRTNGSGAITAALAGEEEENENEMTDDDEGYTRTVDGLLRLGAVTKQLEKERVLVAALKDRLRKQEDEKRKVERMLLQKETERRSLLDEGHKTAAEYKMLYRDAREGRVRAEDDNRLLRSQVEELRDSLAAERKRRIEGRRATPFAPFPSSSFSFFTTDDRQRERQRQQAPAAATSTVVAPRKAGIAYRTRDDDLLVILDELFAVFANNCSNENKLREYTDAQGRSNLKWEELCKKVAASVLRSVRDKVSENKKYTSSGGCRDDDGYFNSLCNHEGEDYWDQGSGSDGGSASGEERQTMLAAVLQHIAGYGELHASFLEVVEKTIYFHENKNKKQTTKKKLEIFVQEMIIAHDNLARDYYEALVSTSARRRRTGGERDNAHPLLPTVNVGNETTTTTTTSLQKQRTSTFSF